MENPLLTTHEFRILELARRRHLPTMFGSDLDEGIPTPGENLVKLNPMRGLDAEQRRAAEEGLPYQSLIASILHKYVSGTADSRR